MVLDQHMRSSMHRNEARTVLVLPGAMATIRAVGPGQDLFPKKTLLPFSYPPVAQSVQQNLSCAQSADPIPRGIRIRICASGHGVDVREQLKVN